MLPDLVLDQYQYDLPDERIARFPLPQRDGSKLLVYRQGKLAHHTFRDLPDLLPPNSYLVFNNTKVIPARLLFTRSTGGIVELFLLNPAPADRPITDAMADEGETVWRCMVGNRKRWKADEVLQMSLGDTVLTAEWANADANEIRFCWQPAHVAFAEIVQQAGQMPLPPYLKRAATEADSATYQTVYARQEGAVAAPTAGLHFTEAVFDDLAKRGIAHDTLTLHVGAGTFQPIKTTDVRAHTMHSEQVIYTQKNLENLLPHLGYVIPVGTTSMRSLESLYWFGVRLLQRHPDPFHLDQHYAYNVPSTEQPDAETAIRAVLTYLRETSQPTLTAHTGIYITPGYQLRVCRGIITNFHQPGSTLILLIATLVGNDWRTIYNEALAHDYRFLSYGDSSLLLP
ncbi:S-adenosylmethionine:tRNA ribosyltransferase-isomerase [Fibrella sp. WM1]|uniref:S-adenosylmethionine:tRNA ribosyltransferase-isomerase n=1 Tax=Fibrella musci TaxID=3242485 RepID=UPI00352167DE